MRRPGGTGESRRAVPAGAAKWIAPDARAIFAHELTRADGAATLAGIADPIPGLQGRTVNSSEITFLALGIALGGALGAAFLAAVRTRPARPREVRITITPNAIGGRRSATLSDAMGGPAYHSPVGSPDDDAWPDRPDTVRATAVAAPSWAASADLDMRTRVLFAPVQAPTGDVAVGIDTGPADAAATGFRVDTFRSADFATLPSASADPAATVQVSRVHSPVAVAERPAAVAVAEPRMLTAVLDVGTSSERLVRPRLPAEDARPTLAEAAVAVAIAQDGGAGGAAPDSSPVLPVTGAPRATSARGATDPCAASRAAMDERCTTATAMRERSRAAATAARDAQRAYEVLEEQVARGRELSDPKTIAATKTALRDQFRVEERAAKTPDESETAARRWLQSINEANEAVRAARRLVETATTELRDRAVEVDRLALDADAARISAEGADEACRVARDELARCEEQVAANAPAPVPAEPHPFAGVWPTEEDLTPIRPAQGAPADSLAGQSAILRLVRGDRAALDRVVAAVAGSDAAAVADWQIRITALSDAIVARAIEAGYLTLPEDHPFWGLFSDKEQREIIEALSALGFRFDGLGGFADGRVPATRDLSLAVGYAGLDRMRIRTWPRDAEIAALYSDASVAADTWLIWAANDLELGTLTSALGPRAVELGPIWDAWGRVRPALVAVT